MKNTKLYTNLMIALLLVFISSSCSDLFDEHDTSYQGPDQVEFTPHSNTVEMEPADSDTTITVDTQLIAEQKSNDLTFDVQVVDSLTTADEGTHYTLPSSSVTIPANSSSAEYSIVVSGEDYSDAVTLAVELQGTDGVEPAENLKTYTLTLTSP